MSLSFFSASIRFQYANSYFISYKKYLLRDVINALRKLKTEENEYYNEIPENKPKR